MLVLDEKSKTPLYAQLYQQIKRDILSGHVKAGTKLKSSRKVAADFRISRNTVESAYEQLCSEGLITSKPRKGYYVERLTLEAFHKNETARDGQGAPAELPSEDIPYDFRPGNLHLAEIPFAQWQRLTNKCFHDYKEGLARYGPVFGELGLRAEIQRYLHDYRDVNCTVDQILVGAGTQFCLGLVCRLMEASVLKVAMEEPGYDKSRITFQNNGLKVYPVELDEHGLKVKALGATDATAAYVTPSRQFPAGMVMPITRRLELVEWARHRNALIIEDDHNCHFQHDLKPIPSLQSLCGDRVIHLGSFSDMLSPALRLSYMVVPGNLLEELHKRFEQYAPFVPFLTQKTLELFMREGHWESQVRKSRKQQKEKCAALVRALKKEFGNSIRIFARQAGLHLLVQAKWPMPEAELIRRARGAGVGVYPTSRYWIDPKSSEKGTVLLNFGGMAPAHIPIAVKLLHQAWLE